MSYLLYFLLCGCCLLMGLVCRRLDRRVSTLENELDYVDERLVEVEIACELEQYKD